MKLNKLKIDPEICLNMNLNTNNRTDGFSSIVSNNNLIIKQQINNNEMN